MKYTIFKVKYSGRLSYNRIKFYSLNSKIYIIFAVYIGLKWATTMKSQKVMKSFTKRSS